MSNRAVGLCATRRLEAAQCSSHWMTCSASGAMGEPSAYLISLVRTAQIGGRRGNHKAKFVRPKSRKCLVAANSAWLASVGSHHALLMRQPFTPSTLYVVTGVIILEALMKLPIRPATGLTAAFRTS